MFWCNMWNTMFYHVCSATSGSCQQVMMDIILCKISDCFQLNLFLYFSSAFIWICLLKIGWDQFNLNGDFNFNLNQNISFSGYYETNQNIIFIIFGWDQELLIPIRKNLEQALLFKETDTSHLRHACVACRRNTHIKQSRHQCYLFQERERKH